jgi:glycosyltransferase involved in cell wall biosynthesis
MKPESETIEIGKAAFIIPFWSDGKPQRLSYLKKTLESIWQQSDTAWHIYITDDFSPHEGDKEYLRNLQCQYPEHVTVTFLQQNHGCGEARNVSARRASADGRPFICWLDSDDIASPNRVAEVRKKFLTDPCLDLVYGNIEIIDEDGLLVRPELVLPSIGNIIRDINVSPLEGYDVWIKMAVERGNLSVPSAVNLRTNLALRFPFPDVPFCEDIHTWFRYSGGGAKFAYSPLIPTQYRVPQRVSGSESRVRAGGIENFNRYKCQYDTLGLDEAMTLARARGAVSQHETENIRVSFLLRLAALVAHEGQQTLALEQLEIAKSTNIDAFHRAQANFSDLLVRSLISLRNY